VISRRYERVSQAANQLAKIAYDRSGRTPTVPGDPCRPAIWPVPAVRPRAALCPRRHEAVDAADAGLAINSNFVHLWSMRGDANVFGGHFEQAKSDILQALRFSPRDPRSGTWTMFLCDAELGLGHLDAAIEDCHKSTDIGGVPAAYFSLVAASALASKTDETKVALAESRRIFPKLTVKWLTDQVWVPPISNLYDGLRKAGLPEE
jgi:hypothetical protein